MPYKIIGSRPHGFPPCDDDGGDDYADDDGGDDDDNDVDGDG